MKKLLGYAVGVLVAMAGFIAVLYLLPDKGCGGEHCSMDHSMCKEQRKERVWTDAEGKVHKEVIVTMEEGGGMDGCKMHHGSEGKMEGGCKMHGDSKMDGECAHGDMNMEGGCGAHGQMNMEGGSCEMKGNMGGCCCCCRMMMMHGMEKDSMMLDTTVRIKIRSKI